MGDRKGSVKAQSESDPSSPESGGTNDEKQATNASFGTSPSGAKISEGSGRAQAESGRTPTQGSMLSSMLQGGGFLQQAAFLPQQGNFPGQLQFQQTLPSPSSLQIQLAGQNQLTPDQLLYLQAQQQTAFQPSLLSLNPAFLNQATGLGHLPYADQTSALHRQLMLQSLMNQSALPQAALLSPHLVQQLMQTSMQQNSTLQEQLANVQQLHQQGQQDSRLSTSQLPTRTAGTREGFPEKLYRMLMETERDGLSNIISFTPSGNGIMIYNAKAYETEVAKKYFKHGNILSFQRQLYLYGFEKQFRGSEKGAYVHPLFKRDKPETLFKIRRQKADKEGSEGSDDIMKKHLNRLPFPQKLYRLLEEAAEQDREDIVSWDGENSFRIQDVSRFRDLILPEYFKHKQMPSFRRQLDLYGFKREYDGGPEGFYTHPSFVRGQVAPLSSITRSNPVSRTAHLDDKEDADDAEEDSKIPAKEEESGDEDS